MKRLKAVLEAAALWPKEKVAQLQKFVDDFVDRNWGVG